MANYTVDIGVALKGAEKVGRFSKQIQDLAANIKGANIFLESFAEGGEGVARSVGNLQKNLGGASKNLKEVALDTKEATIAAAGFLKAQNDLNDGLVQQQKLLDDLSGVTAKKTAADNKKLQDALYKLELEQTRKLEERFETRQQFQKDFKQEITKINEQRQKENQLLKENVIKTKESVAEEIKKKFSIIASQTERRKNLKKSVKELETSRARIPIEDRINARLKKRGLILSANGKKIIKNNQNQKAGGLGTKGNVASSAIIGGAFPLLFGQTGAAAVGGGIGGAAGGLIGGQFGFALSILGTAIGSAIEQADKLNMSIASLDFSFKQAGDSSGFTKDKLSDLKTTLSLTRDEALSVVGAFARFGEAGASAAFLFGKNPNTLKNLAAIVNTKSALAAILDTSNNLTIQQQIQLLQQGKISSFAEFQAKINQTIIEQNFAKMMQEASQIKNTERLRFLFGEIARYVWLISSFGTQDLKQLVPEWFLTGAERAKERVNKLREELEKFKIDLPVLQDLMKDFNLEMEGMSYSIPAAMDQASTELRKLMSVGYQVTTAANTIGDAFGESFKGIIKGSMTAQQALANLFQRTADAFLDMAAQMIAQQIRLRILGIGLSWFGGGASGGGGGKYLDSNKVPLVDPLSDMGTAADGGYIPGRKPTLVGEEGPEIFMPNSGGTVIPNHDLGGLGGSTNIVVNVDASGSSVEGDEQSGEELGRLIAAAIQSELIKEKRPGGLLS